jgi:hypothetical protein
MAFDKKQLGRANKSVGDKNKIRNSDEKLDEKKKNAFKEGTHDDNTRLENNEDSKGNGHAAENKK